MEVLPEQRSHRDTACYVCVRERDTLAISTCFAECKGELGMDHYELRFWRGWHHHMTLVILAHHFLVRW